MAKDFVRQILETEEECKSNEAQAKKQAEEKKQDAKKQSEKFISDAYKDVEKMLEDDKNAVSKSIDLRLEKERVKVQTECKKLSEKAEKNRSRVAAMAVDALI